MDVALEIILIWGYSLPKLIMFYFVILSNIIQVYYDESMKFNNNCTSLEGIASVHIFYFKGAFSD